MPCRTSSTSLREAGDEALDRIEPAPVAYEEGGFPHVAGVLAEQKQLLGAVLFTHDVGLHRIGFAMRPYRRGKSSKDIFILRHRSLSGP